MLVKKQAKNASITSLLILVSIVLMPTILQPTTATNEGTFSIIWITDTQYLAESNPTLDDNLSRWIVNNAGNYNLKMVIHTGDLVNDEGNLTQWQNANKSMGILLDNGIPYTWNVGNHDFNKSYYTGNQYSTFNPEILALKQYWISTEDNGMNNAVYFNASGWECLIVNIAYDANDTVLNWVNRIIVEHPNAHVIVATHDYLDKHYQYDDWAVNLKIKVLDTHPNVFLTLNGHYHPTAGLSIKVGERYELLFDQQDAYDKLGAASARILTFNLTNGTINVQTYSVYLNQFLEDLNNKFTLHASFRNDAANNPGFSFVGLIVVVFVLVAVGFSLLYTRSNVRFSEL